MMEWILEHRNRVRQNLASAHAAEAIARGEYDDACADMEHAAAEVKRIERLLDALDQFDPSTRAPEMPL
jgi:2-keto-3-deoxy-L-rhamnonate aldolase RhmA